MHRVIQLCTALFLSLYTYLTLPVYSNNFIWCIASLLLLLFGTLRKPRESLFAAGLVLLGYGGYELYLYYTAEPAITLGWNELIWLLVFPYAAIIGGISQYAGKTSRPNGLSLYNMLHADEQAGVTEISTVDAQLEYMSGRIQASFRL
ncbi:MAG: hypothetical protein K0Q59_1974 [Paenibacillus sp.]|nr:hypothetical protein [Paenibacillus sp.]